MLIEAEFSIVMPKPQNKTFNFDENFISPVNNCEKARSF